MDSLRTGVLFSTPDGSILLSNEQMQRLMTVIAGRVYRNGSNFYNLLASGDLQHGCWRRSFEGQIVCFLPKASLGSPFGTAWIFIKTELQVGKKIYIELTATDITERWELTAQLQRQNGELERRGEELKRTIGSLHILSRERETQKAKIRAHDILGQRMTILLRAIRDEQALEHGELRSLTQGLLEEMKAEQGEPSPGAYIDSLRQTFGFIGVEIRLEGPLPEDCVQGRLFVEIVREGVTNAVRHGFATEIVIRMEHTDSGCRMRITNNGPPPPENFAEGGGLSGMRKKLEPCGGVLRVIPHPQFTLEIELPGGDGHV
jgi:signal transduction histidine kinase